MECRNHNHGSNKGVCPCCLRDKLSRLPNTTSYFVIYRSDDDSSSPATPVKDNHRRAGSMSMTFAVREALSGGNLIEALGGGLKKSRSVAHHLVTSSNKKTTETAKKKSGFWTKLLHLKGRSGGGGGGSDVGGLVTNSRQRVY